MKARDRTARNSDEAEGEQLTGKDGTGAIHEACNRRQLQLGMSEADAHREQEDNAQLHKRAQVVARSEQQPHWKNARQKAVTDDGDGQHNATPSEHRGPSRRKRNRLAAENAREYEHEADQRAL